MTDLDNATGKHVLRCHTYGFVLIASDASNRVTHILEFHKELHHRLEAFGRSEHTYWNVVSDVIHTIDERNLLVVAFYGYILPVHNQRTTEALPVAVPSRDIIIVGERFQLSYDLAVGAANTFVLPMRKRADTRPFQMQRKNRLRRTAIIDAEVAGTIVAVVAIDASP